jgi:myo-inositol 2-dehydrogenase / D-chiro-inositol 1-dehydrogenase
MEMKRFAVVGAGRMAKIRTEAFLATKRAVLVGVASRSLASARQFAKGFNCQNCFDDYRQLSSCRPDAVLIEVPHQAQDTIAMWALESGYHLLIGGCLSSSVAGGSLIGRTARDKGLVVEAGYEARYKAVWESARRYLKAGDLGKIIAVRSIALWAADPDSWYYSQKESGGMPLTHMTYTFINPMRWIFGEPLYVSAFANRIKHTAQGMIEEETCIANMLFGDDVLCTMTAGFVKAGGSAAWMLTALGTAGTMDIFPSENGPGALKIYSGERQIYEGFENGPNAFEVQAQRFFDALNGGNGCRNRPEDSLGDIRVAEAIVLSARDKSCIQLGKSDPTG